MSIVDELIAKEVNLYVKYCELASEHESDEIVYRRQAHKLFYHIIELRSTREVSDSPIDTK